MLTKYLILSFKILFLSMFMLSIQKFTLYCKFLCHFLLCPPFMTLSYVIIFVTRYFYFCILFQYLLKYFVHFSHIFLCLFFTFLYNHPIIQIYLNYFIFNCNLQDIILIPYSLHIKQFQYALIPINFLLYKAPIRSILLFIVTSTSTNQTRYISL